MLFLQLLEWSEELQEWDRELQIKCTYNGIQLSQQKKNTRILVEKWNSDQNFIFILSETLAYL